MKVVKDIISYLNGRRLLAPDDLVYLRSRGFIDFEEEADLLRHHFPLAAQNDPDVEGDTRDFEVALIPRVRHRRTFPKTRAPLHPHAALISTRVQELWPSWQTQLSSLNCYAAHAQNVRTLDNGLAVIKRFSEATLDAVTASSIRMCRPSLPELWRGLVFDDYHASIAALHLRGPAAVALREILKGRRQGDMGSYAAALTYPGFARLYALVQAQRAVLASVGRLVASDPYLFDRCLFERAYEPDCYWALTIVMSSHVFYQPTWPVPVHAPSRPFLSGTELANAVRSAAMLDVRLMARLLAEDANLPALCCPCSWDERYFPSAHVTERAA